MLSPKKAPKSISLQQLQYIIMYTFENFIALLLNSDKTFVLQKLTFVYVVLMFRFSDRKLLTTKTY
jgi:hypothetical protein